MTAEQSVQIPGYICFEYILVLSPHEDLCKKITEIKESFADKYKSDEARWGKPYVTLATFVQRQMLEERLINRLQLIATGYHSVKIEMKDFGSFPSHTIYINVTSKIPVQNLVKNIRHEALRLMKLDEDNKPHFIMEPYLSIARKLKPWQYEKAWLEYSNKNFTAKFISEEMILLRRKVGEKRYVTVQCFKFKNLPVNIKQGELFL